MIDVEALAIEECRPGVSPGAAARQLCRSLPQGSRLRTMLELMLADANRASFDRSQILQEFKESDADAGLAAELRSFNRVNAERPAFE